MFSDSESSDSDSGIRFKTDSTRNKDDNKSSKDSRPARDYRGSSRDGKGRDRDYSRRAHYSSHRTSRHDTSRDRRHDDRDKRKGRSPTIEDKESRSRFRKKDDIKSSPSRSRSKRSTEKRYSPVTFKESDKHKKEERGKSHNSDSYKSRHGSNSRSDQKLSSHHGTDDRNCRSKLEKRDNSRNSDCSPRKQHKHDEKERKLELNLVPREYSKGTDKIKDDTIKKHHNSLPEKILLEKAKDKDFKKSQELKLNQDLSLEGRINKDRKADRIKSRSSGKSKERSIESLSDGECSPSNSEDDILPSKPKSKVKIKSSSIQKSEVCNGHLIKSKRSKPKSLESLRNSTPSLQIYSGPALPPHLLKARNNEVSDKSNLSSRSDSDKDSPNKNKSFDEESIISEKKSIGKKPIGPSIPDHLKEVLAQQEVVVTDVQESSDEDVVGPLPIGADIKNAAFLKLEERALKIKMAQLDNSSNKQDEATREEWMLELPAAKATNLGLGPRQFRARAGPDMSDRSTWTDTPIDKARKAIEGPSATVSTTDLEQEGRQELVAKRDAEQEKLIKKYKKKHKRDESLMEIHQKDLQKKKKSDEDSGNANERRPFSRDVDLKVNKFDEAQKKAIFKKAALLDTRFSRGESKFL